MDNVICYICGDVYPKDEEASIDSWLKSGRLKGTAWLRVEPLNTYCCEYCRNEKPSEILQDIKNSKKKNRNKK